MSGTATLLAAGTAAVVCLASSPYLARLTVSVPDRAERAWWRGAAAPAPIPILTAGLATLAGWACGRAAGWSALWPAFVLLALVAVPLAVIDARHQRLPDRLLLPAVPASIALLTLAAAPGAQWSRFGVALACGTAVFVLFALVWFALPRSLGFGDVKLLGWLTLNTGWFGVDVAVLGLLAGFVVGAVVALGRMLAGRAGLRTRFAFGPMLIAGALITLLVA